MKSSPGCLFIIRSWRTNHQWVWQALATATQLMSFSPAPPLQSSPCLHTSGSVSQALHAFKTTLQATAMSLKLLISCGHQFSMQVLTNNLYQAPLHRVRAAGDQSRQSTVFFLNPAYSADIAPLPGCAKNSPAYR